VALEGLVVPTLTLFDGEGRLDLPKNSRFARGLLDEGVLHLFTLAPAGEPFLLSRAERVELAEKLAESSNFYSDLWAGIPPGTAEEAGAFADEMEAAGASVHVIYPPPSPHPPEAATLGPYLQSFRDRTRFPLVLLNQPSVNGYALPPSVVSELASRKLLDGLLDADPSPSSLAGFLSQLPQGLPVLTGRDRQAFADLRAGARGAVLETANVLPKLGLALVEAAGKGDEERGQTLQSSLDVLCDLASRAPGPAGLKFLSRALRETDDGYREPNGAPPPEVRQAIEAALAPHREGLSQHL
jgi:4-hydroxy-tetrahydrodipicolinate synthase